VAESGRTSRVTVLIAPPSYIVKKIGHEPIDRTKSVQRLIASEMPMIAFARFVVISHHTAVLYNESKPILETMLAPGPRLRQGPRYQFNEGLLVNNYSAVEKQPGLHARGPRFR